MNFKDLLQLAGQGKVVITDESGDVKGVLLPFDEYKKIAGNKPQTEASTAHDIAEKVNREILQAQLEEVISSADAALPELPLVDPAIAAANPNMSNAERIDSLISKRAQNLFKTMPYNYTGTPDIATTPAPIAPLPQDEEISTNFDDI